MKLKTISRRRFIMAVLLATPVAVCGDAWLIEPTGVVVRRRRFGPGPAKHRLVHFSDLHHKGDRGYLQSVVGKINALAPDFVCFTGDLVENRKFLPETLEILSGLKAPLFGVPGNRDYLSGISFTPVQQCFAATGGAWLMDEHRTIAGDGINLIGITCNRNSEARLPINPSAKNILLMHYPAQAKRLGDQKFDLLLAGHSHGGQVRIPFYGAVVLPARVDEYDLGLFQTTAGPLYVNAGIGYIGNNNFRFNCRPEITLIEV
jgi:predicted MPP superfamily phosphohydrolase